MTPAVSVDVNRSDGPCASIDGACRRISSVNVDRSARESSASSSSTRSPFAEPVLHAVDCVKDQQAAAVDDAHTVRELVGLLHVVRRDDDGRPAGERAHVLAHEHAALRIEPRLRFVEEEHRTGGARARARCSGGAACRPRASGPAGWPSPPGRTSPASSAALARASCRVRPYMRPMNSSCSAGVSVSQITMACGDDADRAEAMRMVRVERAAVELDAARVRAQQAAEHPKRGCLAGAVRAEEAEDSRRAARRTRVRPRRRRRRSAS